MQNVNYMINKYPKNAITSRFLISDRLQNSSIMPSEIQEEPDFFAENDDTQTAFDFASHNLLPPPSFRFYGSVWPQCKDYLIQQWSTIHADIRDFLVRRNIYVNVYDRFPDHFWDDANNPFLWVGFYDKRKKQIMLAQNTTWAPSVFLPSHEIDRVLLHEIGHAVDRNLSDMSDRDGFAKAYQKDYAKVYDNAEVCEYFERYMSDIGRSEVFAEIWALQGNSSPNEAGPDYASYFKEWFSHSWKWIKANVPSAHSGFDLPNKTLRRSDEAGLTPFENIGTGIDRDNVRKLLIQGANPLRLDTYNKTPLDHAMRLNKPDYVKEILLFLIEHPECVKDGDKHGVISRAKIYVQRNLSDDEEKTHLRNWLNVLVTAKQ